MRKCFVIFSVAAFFLVTFRAAQAADFAGGGMGPVPDNNPAGLQINFNVSGVTPTVDLLDHARWTDGNRTTERNLG